MSKELVFNLWAVYDAQSGLVYALSGRAYYMEGSDEDKLKLLKTLSKTDYLTAKRYELPDRFIMSFPDGRKQKVTLLNTVGDPSSMLFEETFQSVVSELPPIEIFNGDESEVLHFKVPDSPLCLTTTLYEDLNGSIRPIITDRDREWVAEKELVQNRRWSNV
jgi:hypothetical protein